MATNVALLLVVTFFFHCVLAQPATPSFGDGAPYHYNTNFSPGIAVLIVVLVAFFFIIIFFTLYVHRCTVERSLVAPISAVAAAAADSRDGRRGLDEKLIETFPTMAYSEVMELKMDKEPLECAVCLCEFTEDESLRMLPQCCHVFHPECIDTWLAGQVTCPVCRADLSVVPVATEEPQLAAAELAIDISKIGRSNTTGHLTGSAAADRFTLRLPEHVRREMVMKRSASIAVAFPAKGEASSKSGYRRGRSERWGSFVRTLSIWRRGEAEGTSSSSEPTATHKRKSSLENGGNDQSSSGTVRSNFNA